MYFIVVTPHGVAVPQTHARTQDAKTEAVTPSCNENEQVIDNEFDAQNARIRRNAAERNESILVAMRKARRVSSISSK